MEGSRPFAEVVNCPSSTERSTALMFDDPVAADGYHWWYLDALSSDGCSGLTVIAFIGSVFSPYYARARREGAASPVDHCALNVALYAAGRSVASGASAPNRWAMTERGRAALDRTATHLAIGPSRIEWDGTTLTVSVEEVTCPWPSRLRGTIRLRPDGLARHTVELDAEGRHRWRPLAPSAHVELDFTEPGLRWTGHGYLDSNAGDEPLEAGFDSWHWSRAFVPRRGCGTSSGRDTIVLYDVTRRGGGDMAFALRYDNAGVAHELVPPPRVALPHTGWRIPRATRADAGVAPSDRVRVLRTLENTPFYARSLLQTRWKGETVQAMHESLSLNRFRTAWVRTLLPFRMPRRARWDRPRD